MTEHEAGPLDDRPVALHRAITALQRLLALRALLTATSPKDAPMPLSPLPIVPVWQQAADFNVWNQVVTK